MNITDIRVKRVYGKGKMLAIASITIENAFVVHDIKIIDGERGLFIAMPSRRSNDGEYRDIAHPLNTETRNALQDEIIAAYLALPEEETQNM